MKRIIMGGILAAATLVGGLAITNTASAAAPVGVEEAWNEDKNKESYWEARFGMECTKYSEHSGWIPAEYDAAVTKKGSSVVVVYADLTNVGAFQATHPQGEPPMSWVMKCKLPDEPTKDDEITYGDWVGEPECDEESYVETRTVTTVSFTWDGEEFIAGDPVVTEEKRIVEVEEVEPCPTTPTTAPPTTAPPTTQPEVTTTTAVVPEDSTTTSTTPPVVETTVPPTTPTTLPPPPPELPHTGGETTIMALIAGLLTLAGIGGIRLARRP